jgi:hypothetical protein
MAILANRQLQIPGGFKFYIPELKWQPRPYQSFDQLVQQVIAVRGGNPQLTAKNKWSTDYNTVASEVDAFNARVCEQMGWNNYIIQASGAPPPPKSKPPSASDQKLLAAAAGAAKKIWAGVRTLNDWLDSGTPAVPQVLADARAATCAACPLNGPGDFTQWFTKPAAEAIQRQLTKLEGRKLSTASDGAINICEACLCPLKLKVHAPMQYIAPHVSEEVLRELAKGKNCWILAEMKK